MSKYVVLIKVEVDGEFKSVTRVEDDDIVRLNSQLEFAIEAIKHELEGGL